MGGLANPANRYPVTFVSTEYSPASRNLAHQGQKLTLNNSLPRMVNLGRKALGSGGIEPRCMNSHSWGDSSKNMCRVAYTWLWVKTCTPGEHQNRWYRGVHPPQNGGMGYDAWPHGTLMNQPGASAAWLPIPWHPLPALAMA